MSPGKSPLSFSRLLLPVLGGLLLSSSARAMTCAEVAGMVEADAKLVAQVAKSSLPPVRRLSVLLKLASGESVSWPTNPRWPGA